MMRCIRFATQLNFYIDDDTFESLCRNKERISIISKERIADELNKILLSPVPSKGFIDLDRSGLLQLIFPELVALQGVETRNGRAHKDNFYHTLEVLDNISKKTDLGEKIEKADYKLGEDGNVIAFLNLNKDKNIRVHYLGERSYATVMTPNDRKAVAAVYELAQLLSSITEIKKNMEEANLKIEFVNAKCRKEKVRRRSNKSEDMPVTHYSGYYF
jgi:tRNA nucleotidyltransferase/poly(A) polymerase